MEKENKVLQFWSHYELLFDRSFILVLIQWHVHGGKTEDQEISTSNLFLLTSII